MKSLLRISFLTLLLSGQMFASFADRGAGKKRGNKVVLNIKSPASFSSSLNFNLRNGLKYTGSFTSPLVNTQKNYPNQFSFNTFVTYQKGNSVYIVPYKQKIFVADYHQGFAGTKLIIKIK
jgi:hypothetical protein